MKYFNHILFFVFIVLETPVAFSQIKELKIYSNDSLENDFLKQMNFKKKINNPSEATNVNRIDSISNHLLHEGYLNNKIESMLALDSIMYVRFKLNKKNKFIQIDLPNNVDVFGYIQSENYQIFENHVVVPFIYIDKFMNDLLLHYENKGYSFVTASLKKIHYNKGKIRASLVVNRKFKRNIDRVVVQGYEEFPIKFIKKHTSINKKRKFTKSIIKSIYNDLERIPFITQLKKPQVLFLKDSTLIYIYLKKKKSNLIDGVVGFGSDDTSKIRFNGSLNMELNNIFNKGEKVGLHWKSNNENKLFDLSVEIPYVFKSNFSTNIDFSIFSQDTTYVNINTVSVLKYQLNYKNSLGLVFENEKSIDLKEQVDNIESYNSNLFGVNYMYLKATINNSFYKNERKIEFNILYGNQKYVKSNSTKTKISLIGDMLIEINKRNYLYLKNNSKYEFSNNYYSNELSLLGGIENLRGFKDRSISANTYTITNIDYNFKVGKESFLYSIFDYALIKNNFINETNSLFGLGIGYKTELKSSVLNIAYVTGFSNKSRNSFKNSVFNISLTSVF